MKKRINKRKIIIWVLCATLLTTLFTFIIITLCNNYWGRVFVLLCLAALTAMCFGKMISFTFEILINLWTEKEEKYIVKKLLRTDEYTELTYTSMDDENMWKAYYCIAAIDKKNDCKFFAKLEEDESITLKVLDSKDCLITTFKTSNYYDFNLRFKEKL